MTILTYGPATAFFPHDKVMISIPWGNRLRVNVYQNQNSFDVRVMRRHDLLQEPTREINEYIGGLFWDIDSRGEGLGEWANNDLGGTFHDKSKMTMYSEADQAKPNIFDKAFFIKAITDFTRENPAPKGVAGYTPEMANSF